MNPFVEGAVLGRLTMGSALLLTDDLVAAFFALLLSFAAAVCVGFAEIDLESHEARRRWAVA